MIENLPIKVDDVGRIVIPKKVRKELDININDILLLSTNNKKIELIKKESSESEKKLLKKLNKIYKETNLEMILIKENKIIYSSKNEKLCKKKVNDEIKNLKKGTYKESISITKDYTLETPYIYCVFKIDNYTKYALFITYKNKEEEKIASFVSSLIE